MTIQFTFDPELSRDQNFRLWYEANTLEKESYGLKPYTLTEARNVFDQLYDLFDKTPGL